MLRDTHSEPGLPLVCPLIDDKFRHNIVKVYYGTTRLRLNDLQVI